MSTFPRNRCPAWVGIRKQPQDDRQAALQQLAQGILSSKADLEGFLATDPAQMAEALQRYPNAAVMLRRLRGEQSGKLSPQIAEKLDLVIEALEAGGQ